MQNIKRYLIVLLFPSILLSQVITSATLLEVPSAKFPTANIFWEGGLSFSRAMKNYDKDIEPHPMDADLYGYFTYFGRYLFGLKIYTLSDVSVDFSYLIMGEFGRYPGLAIGIRNITYKRYINPAGSEPPEGGFRDENYRGKFRRNPELLSFYLVATKSLGEKVEISLGIGRGEFVGYGPRSKYLNIDYYMDSYHDLSFGLFGGGKINILPSLSFIGEIDGRDLNIGLKFQKRGIGLALAFTKLEGLFFVKEDEHPFYRFTGALTVNSNIIPPKPLPVYVTFSIYDKEIKQPLKEAIITFPRTNIPPLKTDEKGEVSREMMPGVYMVRISMPEYKTLKIKLNVKRGRKKLKVEVPLTLKITRKERAFTYIKSARENIEKGNFYQAKKDYEQAKKIFPAYPGLSKEYSQFLTLYQNKIISARSKALEYESKGELQNAIKAWQEVLRLDPENEEAHAKIKTLAEEITRKKVTPKKPRRKPSKPTYTKAQIQRMLDQAIAEYQRANYKRAKELLEKILAVDPKNTKAKEYLKKTERRLKLLGK